MSVNFNEVFLRLKQKNHLNIKKSQQYLNRKYIPVSGTPLPAFYYSLYCGFTLIMVLIHLVVKTDEFFFDGFPFQL